MCRSHFYSLPKYWHYLNELLLLLTWDISQCNILLLTRGQGKQFIFLWNVRSKRRQTSSPAEGIGQKNALKVWGEPGVEQRVKEPTVRWAVNWKPWGGRMNFPELQSPQLWIRCNYLGKADGWFKEALIPHKCVHISYLTDP